MIAAGTGGDAARGAALRDRGEDRLGVATRGVQLVAQPGDRDRARQPLHPSAQRRPDLRGIVDPRRDLAQLTGGPQLVDDRWRDPEPAGDAVDARRHGPGGAKAGQQRRDPLRHLGVQAGSGVREADPAPGADELAGGDEVVDHPAQLRLGEIELGAAAVPARRSPLGELGDACDERVHAQVNRERLGAMESPQRQQDEPLGDVSLLGVDRPDRHAGRVPSIAILIACDSSSDRLCGESPVGDRLGEDPRVRAAMQAAEDDAVPLVVEERDREALVGSGVLERVEADEPDVLEAAQRSPLDDGVHRLHLVHPLGRA